MAEPVKKGAKASSGAAGSSFEDLMVVYQKLPDLGGKSGEPKNTGKGVSSMLSRIKAFSESYTPTGAIKIGVTRKK